MNNRSLETSLRITAAATVIWGLCSCRPIGANNSPTLESSPITQTAPPPDFITPFFPTPILATPSPSITETQLPPTPTSLAPFELNGIYLNNPELSTDVKITLKNGTIFEFNTAFITDSDVTKLDEKCPPDNNKTCTYVADGLTFIFPHSGFTNGPLVFEAIRQYVEGSAANPLTAAETKNKLSDFEQATVQFFQDNGQMASGQITAAVRIPPENTAEFIRNFSDGPSIAARLNPDSATALNQAKFFWQTCGRLLPGESLSPNSQSHNYNAARILFSFQPSF